jgi:predicted dinucleotide-binding enzyme
MQVTIFGAGNMGRGIGSRLVAGGHDVTILDKSAEKAQALAGELGEKAKGAEASGDAIEGDVVVLAVYYPGGKEIVQEYADQLDGKVLVDVSNPVNDTFDDLVELPAGSAAQEIAAVAPPGASVVKAFNTTFAGTLAAGNVAGEPLDVFAAGDDDAKAKLKQLVEDGGLRFVDSGELRFARELEAAGLLHMTLQGRMGTGYDTALKVIV